MLLYIHIPFCDSKCSYCAFNSYVDKFHLKKQYMQALQTQLAFEFKRFDVKQKSIESIFIGGGTPSTINPKLYQNLFETLKPYLQKDIEITTEANPNSASLEWLCEMFDLGINRVSFGVQSFHNEKLKLLNRAHSSKQAINAIENAHKVGFKNISLDLIYATSLDTKELLLSDIQQAFSLPINHLSAYALTIEEGTPLQNTPQVAQEKLDLTHFLFDEIQKNGFLQYEISNFGTYQSTHNKGYWQYKNYIGLGSGAVGKLHNQRFYPTNYIENYIANPLDISTEILSDEDILIEKIFLGLRSNIGISQSILPKQYLKQANILLQENKLSLQNNTFYNQDYLLADEMALFITT